MRKTNEINNDNLLKTAYSMILLKNVKAYNFIFFLKKIKDPSVYQCSLKVYFVKAII